MRAATEVVFWWLAATAAYLLLVSSPTGIEIPVGAVVGAASALVAVAARRAFQPTTEVPAFVRRAVLLPLDVAADTLSLTRMLVNGEAFRAGAGEQDEVRLPDDDATRTWGVLLTSASPGSLAADVEERAGALVLHRHRLTSHQRACRGWEER
jgi:multisubunit Na+/H+ antiporter MnhE subunit